MFGCFTNACHKYSFFVVISTLLNLLFQYCRFFALCRLWLSLCGYIFWNIGRAGYQVCIGYEIYFSHTTTDKADDAKKFVLCAFKEVFTTIIFWGTELTFNAVFKSPYTKYVGAVTGMAVGYVINYFLEKKYDFINKQEKVL